MEKDIIEKLIAEVEKLRGEDLYLALRGQNARLLAVARAARAMLRHENSPDWKRGLIPWREIAEGVNPDDLEALAEALAAVEDLL